MEGLGWAVSMMFFGSRFLICCGISSAAPQNILTPKPPTHNYDELKNVFLKPTDAHAEMVAYRTTNGSQTGLRSFISTQPHLRLHSPASHTRLCSKIERVRRPSLSAKNPQLIYAVDMFFFPTPLPLRADDERVCRRCSRKWKREWECITNHRLE